MKWYLVVLITLICWATAGTAGASNSAHSAVNTVATRSAGLVSPTTYYKSNYAAFDVSGTVVSPKIIYPSRPVLGGGILELYPTRSQAMLRIDYLRNHYRVLAAQPHRPGSILKENLYLSDVVVLRMSPLINDAKTKRVVALFTIYYNPGLYISNPFRKVF